MTKRDFISGGSYFCEKYNNSEQLYSYPILNVFLINFRIYTSKTITVYLAEWVDFAGVR